MAEILHRLVLVAKRYAEAIIGLAAGTDNKLDEYDEAILKQIEENAALGVLP